MNLNEISLELTFQNLSDLNKYFKVFDEALKHMDENDELDLIIKDLERDKAPETRGCKTKLLHQLTKQYKIEHPEIPYRSALRLIGFQMKNNLIVF